MMFGNVAPAPFSCTWAATGTAAPSRAARARKRVDFMSVCSPLNALERELRLEKRLRPRRLECWCRCTVLVGAHVQFGEQPQVGRQLIGCDADEPRQTVVADIRVWIRQIDTREHSRLRVGEVVDAEHAGYRAGQLGAAGGAVARDRVFPGES